MAEHAFTESVAETTQVRAPWRATVRTVVWGLIAFAALAPFLVDAISDDKGAAWAAGYLTVSGAITRVAALPQVEEFLRRFVPWLAAGAKD